MNTDLLSCAVARRLVVNYKGLRKHLTLTLRESLTSIENCASVCSANQLAVVCVLIRARDDVQKIYSKNESDNLQLRQVSRRSLRPDLRQKHEGKTFDAREEREMLSDSTTLWYT
jgi:hypothetical protein